MSDKPAGELSLQELSDLAQNVEARGETYLAGILWHLYLVAEKGRESSYHALSVAFIEATGLDKDLPDGKADVDEDLTDISDDDGDDRADELPM